MRAALGAAILLSLSLGSEAATLTWQGDLDGFWSTGSVGTNTNWTGQLIPQNEDSLIFNLTEPGVLNLTSINNLNGLVLGGTNAILFTNDSNTDTGFTLSGNALTLGGNINSSGTLGTHLHALNLDLILNGTRTVTAVLNTTIAVNGNISELGGVHGLTKTGQGTLVLTGTNSFTGNLLINQGTVSVSSVADSGIASALGAGSLIQLGSGAMTGGNLTYTGTGHSTNRTVHLAATTTGGGSLLSNGTGAWILTGEFTNAGTGQKILTLGGTSTALNEVRSNLTNGNAGGSLSITKTNAGTWVLSGNNTYTGITNIVQGILSSNSIADSGVASSLGAGSILQLGGGNQTGTWLYTGPQGSTNRTLHLASTGIGGGVIDSSGSGPLTLTGPITNAATSGTKTLTLTGTAANNEIQGLIQNGEGSAILNVLKGNNTSSWYLSNDGNAFKGSLTIQRGAVRVSSLAAKGVPSAAGAGETLIFGTGAQTGTLNYTGTGATTDRDILLIVGANTGSGIITNNGTGALVFSGTFTNQGTTGTKTFQLGGANTAANDFQSLISDGGQGGVIAFTKADAGSWTLSNPGNTFTGHVTINHGTLSITNLNDSGLPSSLGAGDTLRFGSGVNTGTLSYTGVSTSTNRAITLISTGTGGGTLQSNGSGPILFSGNFSNLGTSGSKVFTLGGSNTDVNQFQSVISNGSGGGVISLTKAGEGTWALTAANEYTGGTTLQAGTLLLNQAGLGGTSSAIGTGTFTISGGTLDNTSGAAIQLSTSNAVNWNGDFAFGGTNDLSFGTGVVTLGNSNRVITLNGSSILSFGELRWNSVNGARVLTVNQGVSGSGKLILGGFQLNTNTDNTGRNRTIQGNAEIEINQPISNGNLFNNGLVYSGTGRLTLSAANTYTGVTQVNAGRLQVAHANALASTSNLTIHGATVDVSGIAANFAGTLTLGAATTTLGGLSATLSEDTAAGSLTLNAGLTYHAGSVGFENGPASILTHLILGGDSVFMINNSSAAAVDLTIPGRISGGFSLAKTNAGTLRLTGLNTYSGQTFLNAGIIQISTLGNTGSAGSLGTGDLNANAGIIRLGFQASTGTLEYLGVGESSNRRIQIGGGGSATHTGGATLLNNGTGALIFTAPLFNSPTNTGTGSAGTGRTLTLGGTHAGANTIQGILSNNSQSLNPTVSLVKQDSGTWILEGANTYTGGTSVLAGTLIINNNSGSGTGTGSVVIENTAKIGGQGVMGSLTAGATVTLNPGGVLFAGQNGVLDAQTLRIQSATSITLQGTVELDILNGSFSGVLNAQANHHDQIVFQGTNPTLSSPTLKIQSNLPVTPGTWVEGSSWKLFDWAGITGNFSNLPNSGLQLGNPEHFPDLSSLGLAWDWSQLYSNGVVQIAIVPEPSRMLLVLVGAFFALLRRHRP